MDLFASEPNPQGAGAGAGVCAQEGVSGVGVSGCVSGDTHG